MAESVYCLSQTITTLLVGYSPTYNKKFKKEKKEKKIDKQQAYIAQHKELHYPVITFNEA